jgi:HEAT repeat protein
VKGLDSSAPRERIAAATNLAQQGADARSAIPALRRALSDGDLSVRLAAARALVRLGEPEEAVAAVKARLGEINEVERSEDARLKEVIERSAAASTLGEMGPAARSALPELLKALGHEHDDVRGAAAVAVGLVATDERGQREATTALAALLKVEQHNWVRERAVRSLLRFGPSAWTSVQTLGPKFRTKDLDDRPFLDSTAIALLARFDPPPVELLAELAEDRRVDQDIRRSAVEQLQAIGPRARSALPALRRLVRQPLDTRDDSFQSTNGLTLSAAAALLVIDPEGAPELVAPILLKFLERQRSSSPRWVFSLLCRCGALAKPSVPALLSSLDDKDPRVFREIQGLTPLLGPDNRAFLPSLRRMYNEREWDVLLQAEALLRIGERQEALDLVAGCLDKDYAPTRLRAARWLAQRGGGSKSVESALRRALKRAKGGEWAQLVLALRRINGVKEEEAEANALNALDDLLGLCAGESPAVGRLDMDDFWSRPMPYIEREESEAVADAVDTLLWRLSLSYDPVIVLSLSLQDANPHIRLVAALALARVEPRHPDTMKVLSRLLERQPHFFCYAADTLVALGLAAAPLAPLILPLMRHPNDDVYRAADHVLRRIDPAQAKRAWSAAGVPGAVPDDLRPLWDDLAAEDVGCIDMTVWRLAGAGAPAVALLRERLHPPPTMTPEQVRRRIADLDNDDFDTRQHASTDLDRAIETAAPTLRKAQETELPPETRRRIKELLARFDAKESPEQRRRRSAVRVLEVIGDRDARALLRDLSRGDPSLALTREASSALIAIDRNVKKP